MAPNLSVSQRVQIHDMITSRTLTVSDMADIAECSERTIKRHRANLRSFGTTTAPRNRGGSRRTLTPTMLDALCEHLLEKPDEDLDSMILFVWDEFETLVSRWTLSRALSARGWSRKATRLIAQGRNADLRDDYEHAISEFRSEQLVFVDESGCDKRIGFRRYGWSPVGVTPAKIAQFQRGQRYQILPAYTEDGIVLAKVFQGNTDADIFLDFIKQLLNGHCNSYPGQRSVIVMDNASIHRTSEVEEACEQAGVMLVYLPPYSPDKNPIEEFFAELKAFIKKQWYVYEEDVSLEFPSFLEWCIEEVGSRTTSAYGHFRHSGIAIDSV